MKNTAKKTLAMLLALVMVVGLLPGMGLTAYANNTEIGVGTTWNVGDSFNLSGKYFIRDDKDLTYPVLGVNQSGTVPAPVYRNDLVQWAFYYVFYYENKLTTTGISKSSFFFSLPDGKTEQDVPSGIRIKSGDGSQTSPYVFELVYATASYSVTVTAGSNMTKTVESGAASQTDLSGAMTDVVYTANDGYYFPEFTNITDNGITATRTNETTVTVSGTPTANASITIPDAVLAHTHSFTYSASGNVITATCNGAGTCDVTEGLTLTISAPAGEELVADGTTTFPASLSTGYNTTAFPEGSISAISYTKDGAAYNGTPTEAGAYVASVTVGGTTASVSYTVTDPAPAVTYYYKAADGTAVQITEDVTVIDANTTYWGDGWYVADGTVELGAVRVNGAANLVLLDGASLTFGGDDSPDGLYVNGDLNIYAGNTSAEIGNGGVLSVIGSMNGLMVNGGGVTVCGGTVNSTSERGRGIYLGPRSRAFTVCGGTVNAEGVQYGVGVNGGSFTVNGGTVNASSSQMGCYLKGSMTINGGTVNVSSSQYGCYLNGGSMTINGGTVIAKTNRNAIYKRSGTLTLGEGMYLYGGDDEATKAPIEVSAVGNYKYVEFNSTAPTVAVTGVTLTKDGAAISEPIALIAGGDTATLTATVAPENATNKTVVWTTTDANVATVADGVVTAVAAGSATITATATNGTETTDDDFSASCTVTVSAPAPSASIDFKGGSLRRRVYRGTTDVIDFETDIRFGFEFTLPEGATINMSDSYFCWKNNSVATAEDGNKVTIQSVDTSGEKPVANLILTGVPKAYYTTNIFCFVHVEYTLNEQVYTIETVEPYSRSVKEVCDSLVEDTTAPVLWRNYAQSLLDAIK